MMNVRTIVVGKLMTNCYVVINEHEAVIIDPGGNAEKISGFLDENRIKPVAIMLTHSHFDHVLAVSELVQKYNIPLVASDKERRLLENKEKVAARPYMSVPICLTPDILLADGEKYAPFTDGTYFNVLHTPGHTEGGASYYSETLNAVFTGDTLFYMSIGRSDFPTGDHEQLIFSIKEKLLPLGDGVVIYPGHGSSSLIGEERTKNPFLR